jgi:hypothetical protein
VCAHTEKAMGCIAICGLLQVACTICVGVLCVHARTEGMSGIWDARSATGKGARAQAHNRVDYLCLECCNLGRYVRLHAAGPKWDAWARTRVPTCAWRNTAAIPYWVGPRHHPNEEEAGHRLVCGARRCFKSSMNAVQIYEWTRKGDILQVNYSATAVDTLHHTCTYMYVIYIDVRSWCRGLIL